MELDWYWILERKNTFANLNKCLKCASISVEGQDKSLKGRKRETERKDTGERVFWTKWDGYAHW